MAHPLDAEQKALPNLTNQDHGYVAGLKYSWLLVTKKQSYQNFKADLVHLTRFSECHKKTNTILCKEFFSYFKEKGSTPSLLRTTFPELLTNLLKGMIHWLDPSM